jgi:hypothetical protein
VDSLKALDPGRPIREADIEAGPRPQFSGQSTLPIMKPLKSRFMPPQQRLSALLTRGLLWV